MAVQNGHPEVCAALLAAGAVAKPAPHGGIPLLFVAAQQGHRTVCDVLLAAGADINAATADGCTALFIAAKKGRSEVVAALLAAGADLQPSARDGYTPFTAAVQNGHLTVCLTMLAAGASVNAAVAGGATPLHLAAQHGRTEVCCALLAAGAQVSALTATGATPLYFAAANGHRQVCICLLAAAADVNATAEGLTSLRWDLKDAGVEFLPIRRLLVAYGAPIADLRTAGLGIELPKYFAAVRAGARARRAAALSAWVHWHDAADGVPPGSPCWCWSLHGSYPATCCMRITDDGMRYGAIWPAVAVRSVQGWWLLQQDLPGS